MKKSLAFKQRNGMVLIDNHWIKKADAEQYLADRSAAAQKAIQAMSTFCASVKLQWAGSQDGEAVVGFDDKDAIRSVIHLDPRGIQLIHTLSHDKLIDHLK